MKTEIKDKWIKALTSGEYLQGRERLKNFNNTFCCLGVLCDLYIKETGKAQWIEITGVEPYLELDNGITINDRLPNEVCQWAGIETDDSESFYDSTIINMNDGSSLHKPQSFEEIAESINEYETGKASSLQVSL